MELRFPKLESEIIYRLPREAGSPDSFFPQRKHVCWKPEKVIGEAQGIKGPAGVMESILRPPGRREDNPFQMVTVPGRRGPPGETPGA